MAYIGKGLLEKICEKYKIETCIGDTRRIIAEKINKHLQIEYIVVYSDGSINLTKSHMKLNAFDRAFKKVEPTKDVFFKICPTCHVGKNKKAFTGLTRTYPNCTECRRLLEKSLI